MISCTHIPYLSSILIYIWKQFFDFALPICQTILNRIGGKKHHLQIALIGNKNCFWKNMRSIFIPCVVSITYSADSQGNIILADMRNNILYVLIASIAFFILRNHYMYIFCRKEFLISQFILYIFNNNKDKLLAYIRCTCLPDNSLCVLGLLLLSSIS